MHKGRQDNTPRYSFQFASTLGMASVLLAASC